MKTEAQFRTHLETVSLPPFFQFMGVVITEFGNGVCRGELPIRRPDFDGPPGFIHMGRTTQVWDAEVTHKESGRTLALFRCTQMILYPKVP